MEAGKTTTLIASITPSNATDKTITWSSSNTSVAAVSNGKMVGKVTITVKTVNGYTAASTVEVGRSRQTSIRPY